MPTIKPADAVEKLARSIEVADDADLPEIYSEIFPAAPVPSVVKAVDLAAHVRGDFEPEEIVDLWNLMYPEDRHVRYDVDDDLIRYNEELAGTIE